VKTKNFPANKLRRQIDAKIRNGEKIDPERALKQLDAARGMRTKKDRRGGRLR